MTIINTNNLVVSGDVKSNWQRLLNVLAEITHVSSALIMRFHQPDTIEVFCASQSANPPYQVNQKKPFDEHIYCHNVILNKQPLQITNALSSPHWSRCHDAKIGMISYLGQPLCWPDGSVFGTLCLLDNKENQHSETYKQLLLSFKESIEAQLTILFQQTKLVKLNQQLIQRVKKRTEDLATLNYSLSQEIDKRREAEQEIYYQKNHDISTGFLNHFAINNSISQILAETKTDHSDIVVFHIAFSNGRKIQERHGEQVLSDILIAFRERIGNIDCLCSLTARTSISNIIIAVHSNKLNMFIEHFCSRLLDISHSEFTIASEKIHLHTFIGISTSKNTKDAKQLLFYANEAAFSCKESGQKYSYYSHSQNELLQHRNEIESYLLQAVRNDDLILYFQPKVELKTGNWIGAEALIRWNHPILGNISNENLIQMAEQNGLIFEVGNFVLRSAIEYASVWTNKLESFKIAVNVSSVQLKNQNFFTQLEDLLETYHFPPQCLEIEVTESCLISNEYLAKQTLTRIHELGVTLSLDDFGTGCASFSYLKTYPFKCIKIDKSFIKNINENQDDKEIVHSIVQIAKRLELDVTIEGIEDIDQEQFVMNEGCDYAQGFLYGKPMTGEEFSHCIHS